MTHACMHEGMYVFMYACTRACMYIFLCIYVSCVMLLKDGGASWHLAGVNRAWGAVAMDSTGTLMIAGEDGDYPGKGGYLHLSWVGSLILFTTLMVTALHTC